MKNFTFYNNYFELIRYLDADDRLALYDAILEYMFEDKEPEFDGLKKGIWVNIKMPLDTSKINYNNGKKGGAPKGNTNAKKQPNIQPKNNRKTTERITEHTTEKQTNNISYFLFLISNNKYKYIIKDNNIYNIIYKWLNYKQERKELYKETGLSSLLTQIENQISIYGEKNVIDLIEECMANNYKGIIFDKLKNKPKQAQVPSWFDNPPQEEEEKYTEEEQRIYDYIRGNN